MALKVQKACLLITALALMSLISVIKSQPAMGAPGDLVPASNIARLDDSPLKYNNGEGRDLDDIEELKEHWRKPEYWADEQRQIASSFIFFGLVAGYGAIKRQMRRSTAAPV